MSHSPAITGSLKANAKHDAARQAILRLLERDQAKDAYKQAKALYRLDPGVETRQLLERCYVVRTQALVRSGMPNAAKELAESLLALGITDAKLLDQFVPLLPSIGLGQRVAQLGSRLQSPELLAKLDSAIADHAVLRPDDPSPLSAESRAVARSVRESLAAVASGDDARALELIQKIPRQSEFSDWRLFVRGLIAFYGGDDEQTNANWQRMVAGRTPAALATALRKGLPIGAQPGASTAPDVSRLEARVFGEPVLAHLDALIEALADREWNDAFRALRIIVGCLNRRVPRIAERLTHVLLPLVAAEARNLGPDKGEHFLDQCCQLLVPLSLDPHWHRFRAMFSATVGLHFPEGAASWLRYLEDVDGLTSESADRRSWIQALVWYKLGEIYRDARETPAPQSTKEHSLANTYRQAIAAYKRCVQIKPTHRAAWHALYDLHKVCGHDDDAIEVARKALAALPDDVISIERLRLDALRRGDWDGAAHFTSLARQLQPLNVKFQQWQWQVQLDKARRLAMSGHPDEARRELATLAEQPLDPYHRVQQYLHQAAVESRERDFVTAETRLEAGFAGHDYPLACLVMAIESCRYELSPALRKRFGNQLKKACAKKKNGVSVGLLARIMRDILESGTHYVELEQHCADVADYIAKSLRLKLSEPDLEMAFEFAVLSQEYSDLELDLALELARRGAALFPNSAFFLYQLGCEYLDEAIIRGDAQATVQAIDALLAAQSCAGRGNSPHAHLLPQIHRKLRSIRELNCVQSIVNRFGINPESMAAMGFDFDYDEFADEDFGPGGRR